MEARCNVPLQYQKGMALMMDQIKQILICENLVKKFQTRHGDIEILKGVNFSVNKGEIAIIKGKSGAGKSTLLWILGGIERATSGKIIFEGRLLDEMNNQELAIMRRKKIGIIFQNFNLITSWTAFENVESALIHSGMSKKDRSEKIYSLLSEFELSDRVDNLPSELSIGQQQRVAIARAIANEPSLIIADEPTGELDPETATEIITHLNRLVKDKSVTLIIATHGAYPLDFADKIFQLSNGILR
jgi:putative ABC transport system ATP-binding protein